MIKRKQKTKVIRIGKKVKRVPIRLYKRLKLLKKLANKQREELIRKCLMS